MKLTKGQSAVLSAFAALGPMDDTALAVYVHHIADVSMSSSGVRSRRAELSRNGYLRIKGTHRVKSGRQAAIHELTAIGRKASQTYGSVAKAAGSRTKRFKAAV